MQGNVRTFFEKGLWVKIGGVSIEYIILFKVKFASSIPSFAVLVMVKEIIKFIQESSILNLGV